MRDGAWKQDLSTYNIEFDVAWRLVFGGMTSVMIDRIDHPEDGFRWRGERPLRGPPARERNHRGNASSRGPPARRRRS